MSMRTGKLALGMMIAAGCWGAAALADNVQLRFFAGLFDRQQAVNVSTATASLQDRKEKIQELLAIAEGKGVDDTLGGPRHMAITLLGRYRATEAAKALARNLMYLPE